MQMLLRVSYTQRNTHTQLINHAHIQCIVHGRFVLRLVKITVSQSAQNTFSIVIYLICVFFLSPQINFFFFFFCLLCCWVGYLLLKAAINTQMEKKPLTSGINLNFSSTKKKYQEVYFVCDFYWTIFIIHMGH